MTERARTQELPSAREAFDAPESIRWPTRTRAVLAGDFVAGLPNEELSTIPLADVAEPSPELIRRYAAHASQTAEQVVLLARYGVPLKEITYLYECLDDLPRVIDRFPRIGPERAIILKDLLHGRKYKAIIGQIEAFFPNVDRRQTFIDEALSAGAAIDLLGAFDALGGTVHIQALVDEAIWNGQAMELYKYADTLRRHGVDLKSLVWRLLGEGQGRAALDLARRSVLDDADQQALFHELMLTTEGQRAVASSYAWFAHLPGAAEAVAAFVRQHPERLRDLPENLLERLWALPLANDDLEAVFKWCMDEGICETSLFVPVLPVILRALSPEEVVRRLCDGGHAAAVIPNLSTLKAHGYEPSPAWLAAYARGYPQQFLESVPSPAPAGPDYAALTERLVIDEDRVWTVLDNAGKLPPRSLDPATFDVLLDEGDPVALAFAMDGLIRQGLHVQAWSEALIRAGRLDVIAKRIETFMEHGFDPCTLPNSELGTLLPQLPVATAARQQRYAVLLARARIERRLGIVPTRALSEDGFRAAYRDLCRDGRARQAKHLRAYGALAGYLPPNETVEVSPAGGVPAADWIRQDPGGIRVPHEEAFSFYVDDVAHGRLRLVADSPDIRSRMDFAARSKLLSMKAGIERRAEALGAWLRRYLVRAVTGEVMNQFDYLQGNDRPIWVDSDPDRFLATASVEEVLDLLAQAAALFRRAGWDRQVGGMKWAEIAETAYALWATPRTPRGLIDRVFDLEHHTGAVFDKEPERVRLDPEALRAILEAKARAREPEDLFRALMRGDVSPDLVERAAERLAASRRLVERYVR